MKIIQSLFIIFWSAQITAQYSFSGEVIDNTKNPISFANVILLHTATRTIYKGNITDENGKFFFKNIEANTYELRVNFIGYKEVSKIIKIEDNKKITPITLVEDLETLDEVQINAKKPTIKRKVDRLVFNVENTILSTGNAWSILRKTPGVLERNGNLTIRNSSNIIILINDKRVYLSSNDLKDLLEGTSAQDITAIEVITNPPAKYEAEGNAVLNIKMKKNAISGYKGKIGASYRKARFSSGNINTSHYFKNNNVNLYASYSHSKGRGNRLEEEVINFNQKDTGEKYHSFLDRNSWYSTHNLRLNSEFYINKKSSVTLGSQLYYSPKWKGRNITESNVLNNTNNSVRSSFSTLNLSENFTKNLGLDITYEWLLSEKEKLNISGHFTDYKRTGNQEVKTDFFDIDKNLTNNTTFETLAGQITKIYNSQLDYEYKNDKTKLEAGIKYVTINSESDLKHYNLSNNQFVIDNSKSNIFSYTENNISGYISHETSFKKINLKAGLRGEYTSLTGNSITLNQITNNHYFKLFPTLYLQYTPNETHQLSATYGKRITRPNYSSLNPFKFYYSDYSFYQGNPKLQPAITHNLELQYSLHKKYNFDIYYSYISNYITEINFQNNNTNTLRYSFVNIPKNISYGINFNTNFSISDRWSFYTQHSLYYNEDQFTAIENNNQLVKNSIWGYYGYVTTNYQLLKDKSLTAELSFYKITNGIQGSLTIEGSEDLSFGLTKELFSKKAKLSVQLSDILKSQIVKVSTNYLNQNNYFIDNMETQYIRVGFTYNFGNQSLKKKKKKKKIDEKNRL